MHIEAITRWASPEAAAYISCEVIIRSQQDILLTLTPHTLHTVLAFMHKGLQLLYILGCGV